MHSHTLSHIRSHVPPRHLKYRISTRDSLPTTPLHRFGPTTLVAWGATTCARNSSLTFFCVAAHTNRMHAPFAFSLSTRHFGALVMMHALLTTHSRQPVRARNFSHTKAVQCDTRTPKAVFFSHHPPPDAHKDNLCVRLAGNNARTTTAMRTPKSITLPALRSPRTYEPTRQFSLRQPSLKTHAQIPQMACVDATVMLVKMTTTKSRSNVMYTLFTKNASSAESESKVHRTLSFQVLLVRPLIALY